MPILVERYQTISRIFFSFEKDFNILQSTGALAPVAIIREN